MRIFPRKNADAVERYEKPAVRDLEDRWMCADCGKEGTLTFVTCDKHWRTLTIEGWESPAVIVPRLQSLFKGFQKEADALLAELRKEGKK